MGWAFKISLRALSASEPVHPLIVGGGIKLARLSAVTATEGLPPGTQQASPAPLRGTSSPVRRRAVTNRRLFCSLMLPSKYIFLNGGGGGGVMDS